MNKKLFLVFIFKFYMVIYRGMSDLFCSKCESSQLLDCSDDVTQGNILALRKDKLYTLVFLEMLT